MNMSLHTPICDRFGIEVPIVQTGMGWVAGPRLVSATAAAGALGILASATMTFDELASAIREVRARTDRPFGVNLRADSEDADARVALLVREHVPVASFANSCPERRRDIAAVGDAGRDCHAATRRQRPRCGARHRYGADDPRPLQQWPRE